MSRKPTVFPVEEQSPAEAAPRLPRAIATDRVLETAAEFDLAEEVAPAISAPRRRRGSAVGTVFLTALGTLVSLAVGLWTDRLIRNLFERGDWLGWFAVGVAIAAGASLVVLLARELIAVARLRSVEALRRQAAKALASRDPAAARQIANGLAALLADKPETAAGRAALAQLKDDVIDGPDLLLLAERQLLSPLDLRAKALVLEAAKRVSVVTAVSPRAVVDIAYVLFESGRLIRRLSELYAGRPGFLGFLRLARRVLAHLAVTGAIAVGDDFVHQVVGQGLAARLSAKLGEGVVNGMMTARIGVAAMEVTRPLPFAAGQRPGLGDFLSALTALTRRKVDEPG